MGRPRGRSSGVSRSSPGKRNIVGSTWAGADTILRVTAHHGSGVKRRSRASKTAWSMDGKNFAISRRNTQRWRLVRSAAARRQRCVPKPARHAKDCGADQRSIRGSVAATNRCCTTRSRKGRAEMSRGLGSRIQNPRGCDGYQVPASNSRASASAQRSASSMKPATSAPRRLPRAARCPATRISGSVGTGNTSRQFCSATPCRHSDRFSGTLSSGGHDRWLAQQKVGSSTRTTARASSRCGSRTRGDAASFTTGERDSEPASGEAARIYAEVISGRWSPGKTLSAQSGKPFKEVAALWLADIESSIDPRTLRALPRHLRGHSLRAFLQDHRPAHDGGRRGLHRVPAAPGNQRNR